MHFEYPWVFLLVPLFLFCERKCPLRLDLLFFPHVGRVARYARRTSLLQALKWMIWGGLLVALASPVTTKEYAPARKLGRDMVLIVDASRSMDEGFSIVNKTHKFDTLKKVLKDFIVKRKNDRLGLVVFGEYAYAASPLTFDHAILAAMVPHLHVGMAGERTAITDALAMAVKLLKKSDARSKVAILITDGRNTAGKVPFAVVERMLKQYGIKLYTIGVGRRGEYNAALLKEMAEKSGGEFFEANDAAMLQKVYAEIDRLEPSKVAARPVIETTYHFSSPLFVAAMSLLLYLFMMNRGEVA